MTMMTSPPPPITTTTTESAIVQVQMIHSRKRRTKTTTTFCKQKCWIPFLLFISVSSIVLCGFIILKDVQQQVSIIKTKSKSSNNNNNSIHSTNTTRTTTISNNTTTTTTKTTQKQQLKEEDEEQTAPPPLQQEQQSMISLSQRNNETTLTTTSPQQRQQQQQSSYGKNVDATIVIHLSGEMGNHLHHLVHGYGIHLMLLGKDNNDNDNVNNDDKEETTIYSNNLSSSSIRTNIVLRHQESGKWISARDSIQSCFPHFRYYNFSLGNTPDIFYDYDDDNYEYEDYSQNYNVKINKTLLDETFNSHCSKNTNTNINGSNNSLSVGFDHLRDVVIASNGNRKTRNSSSNNSRISSSPNLVQVEDDHDDRNDEENNNNATTTLVTVPTTTTTTTTTAAAAAAAAAEQSNHHDIHFPNPNPNRNIVAVVTINSTCMMSHAFLDRYYDTIRSNYLYYDEQSCCSELPESDETVFHYRNFMGEMGSSRSKRMGFEELSPTKIATELFQNLQPGDKVAIVSRPVSSASNKKNNGVQPLQEVVNALTMKGLSVRVVPPNNDNFCFMMKAQKELVGFAGSTYVQWAAYLGDTPRVRLYIVDSLARRQRIEQQKSILAESFDWTHPKLKSRIRYEIYQSEDVTGNDGLEK